MASGIDRIFEFGSNGGKAGLQYDTTAMRSDCSTPRLGLNLIKRSDREPLLGN